MGRHALKRTCWCRQPRDMASNQHSSLNCRSIWNLSSPVAHSLLCSCLLTSTPPGCCIHLKALESPVPQLIVGPPSTVLT